MPSVWYTSRPFAGLAIAVRWVAVMRGMSIPWVVELTSSIAELSDAAPELLTAIPCAVLLYVPDKSITDNAKVETLFFVIIVIVLQCHFVHKR